MSLNPRNLTSFVTLWVGVYAMQIINLSLILDPCMPNPCENNGNCQVSQETNEFTCNCMPGYSGDLCERPSMLI